MISVFVHVARSNKKHYLAIVPLCYTHTHTQQKTTKKHYLDELITTFLMSSILSITYCTCQMYMLTSTFFCKTFLIFETARESSIVTKHSIKPHF